MVAGVTMLIGGVKGSELFGEIITYDFEAYIDGRDLLIIHDNTLQWHHLTFAAVGRHEGRNEPTIISSSLNGVSQMDKVNWTPEWPEPPPAEIRYETWSSVFADMVPPLPDCDMVVDLRITSVRGSLSIHQYPTISNKFTLILDFNDTSKYAAAWYKGGVDIEYVVVPEPSTATIWSMLMGLALLYSARKRTAK
ncbi:MAG: hypothetical protein FJ276_14475 [Planctomycetes bacterium]|nr:hypothetical protein [Planctomycetota bacterium]